jgi:hypothetical protein
MLHMGFGFAAHVLAHGFQLAHPKKKISPPLEEENGPLHLLTPNDDTME